MAKTFVSDLSVKGLNNLVKQLKQYESGLQKKCEEYVKRLAESGVEVAQQNVGNFGKYLTFTVKTNPEKDGCTAVLLATNTGIIQSEWVSRDTAGNTIMKTADVSPLLMVEFGSGLKAQNPKGIPGVGTGTFPGGTHGTEPGWWYATELDENGKPTNWHYSTGLSPLQPMYKASLKITEEAIKVAQDVFGEKTGG